MANKKLIAAGIAAGIGLTAEIAVHGYLDVMAKPMKVRSVIGYISDKLSADSMSDLTEFNIKKHEWIDKLDTEVIELKNERGNTLKGYYNKADSDVYVFFAHGYRADHGGDPANFQQYYIEKGYNFFCVDHTTCGESEGDWVGFNYFECPDCLMWINYMINRFGSDIKIILHGVSMGGATVCKMADRVPPQVKLIIADCPYTSAVDEFASVAKGAGIKRTGGILKVFNALNKRLAGFDLYETDVRKSVENAVVPMLFVHGKADDFVPTRMGIELYELCNSPKELLLVEGAAHAESIAKAEKEYHKKLDEFTAKYLPINQ